jgi:3-hydroxybutyryl-CoA dehydrogenase
MLDYQDAEAIFDFSFNGQQSTIEEYASMKNRAIILNMVNFSFSAYHSILQHGKAKYIGMNGWPTFINKPVAEITLLHQTDKEFAQSLFLKLNYNAEIIADRVGMVMPRIVGMIINEACYTLQEGTATVNDINMAMKLGTNYPWGPLEWANKIGLSAVYSLLEAMHADTKDERYKICPLLKSMVLRGQSF